METTWQPLSAPSKTKHGIYVISGTTAETYCSTSDIIRSETGEKYILDVNVSWAVGN
jgi:hypothetical protein